MKKKLFSSVALAVVGSLSLGTAAMAATVNGSGATFPQSFLASATTGFRSAPAGAGHTVNYANPGGGSGAGQSAFRNNTVDFAGTDSALTAANTPTFGWVYVPYVAGAIAVAYKLDELGGATLSLSPQTINGIFGGTITKWNDPSIANDLKSSPAWTNKKKRTDLKGATALVANGAPGSASVTVSALPSLFRTAKGKSVEIVDAKSKKVLKKAALNKAEVSITFGAKAGVDYSVRLDGKEIAVFAETNVTLPDKDIIVVYRSDGSGTTNNFCNYIRNAANSDWVANNAFTSCIPGGSARVASFGGRFQGQSGSANVSNYIADTNGTIGYTEVSFVTDPTRAAKGMKAANVRNAAGRYAAPTSANANSFLGGSNWDLNTGFATFNFQQATNTTAYPIIAVTYFLAKTAKSENNAVVQAFAKWIIEDFGPKNAEALGYVPLTGRPAEIALAQIAKINSI
jgi:ABC-type phosphate transport system substrate-binding protein